MKLDDPDIKIEMSLKGEALKDVVVDLLQRKGFTCNGEITLGFLSALDELDPNAITLDGVFLGPILLQPSTPEVRADWVKDILTKDLRLALTLLGEPATRELIAAYLPAKTAVNLVEVNRSSPSRSFHLHNNSTKDLPADALPEVSDEDSDEDPLRAIQSALQESRRLIAAGPKR